MQRYLLSWLLVITSLAGPVLPLKHSEAFVIKNTLKQMPVTGRLADGGTFAGRLTVQALTVNDLGQLPALGAVLLQQGDERGAVRDLRDRKDMGRELPVAAWQGDSRNHPRWRHRAVVGCLGSLSRLVGVFRLFL